MPLARQACSYLISGFAPVLLVPLLINMALVSNAKAQVAASLSDDAPTLAPVVVRAGTANQLADDYRAREASAGVLGNLPLIDTPFSVNVLTRSLLDNQQAAHYGDFLKNDPSATVGNVPVGFTTLRGFSVNTDGYLYDGLPGSVGLSDGRWQLEGIDRIEVLKGPSAFLYGLGSSSSVGGTINFIPKTPTNEPIRNAVLGYTSRALWSAAADIGDRFGTDRQFGLRVNLGYKNGEQAVADYDWTHKAASLAFDWRASRNLLLTVGYDYANNYYPSLQPFFILDPSQTSVPQAPSADRNIAQPWDRFKTIGANEYVKADWQINPDWSLTTQLLSSYDKRPNVKEARFGAISNLAGDALLFGSQDQSKQSADSGQVLLHGSVRTGAVDNKLSFGVTATRGKSESGSTPLGVFPTNIYQPLASPEPADAPVDVALNQRTTTHSVLLSDIAKFSERWSALLGVRHAKLEVDNQDGNPIKVSKTTPTSALMFKPTPASLLYVNYAQGLEQGGRAPVGTTNQNQLLSPITTRQVEIGAKYELDRALTLTAALFDLRKPFEYVDPTTLTYVQNGIQQHRGLELTAVGQATSRLTIVAGTMLLNPRTQNTADPTTEGRRPVGTAQLTGNLYGDYRISSVPGLFVNAGLYASGGQYLDGANSQRVPGWVRVDVGARYETKFGTTRTTFLFGIENLADKSYWSGAQSGILTLAEPRTFKLTASMAY